MQMTWSELAKITPEDYQAAAWPCGAPGNPEQSAWDLLRAANALASSVNGPLVGVSLAVASPRPEHAILARLLACHGAQVSFFCPEPVSWVPGYESLFLKLRSVLEQHYEYLDPAPLRDVTPATFGEGPGFVVERQWPEGGEGPPAPRFRRVFAYDLLGRTPQELGPSLARLAGLLEERGYLEVFGGEPPPAGGPALDRLVGEAFSFGFGAQAATASQSGEWRLNLRWLGGTVREYPSEEDSPHTMAHCEARLHYATHFVAGATVLEAGCGTGLGARLFLAAGASRVVGLDYSHEALAVARGRVNDHRAEFHRWDLNQTPLPLEGERFDVVVCLEVLEHVREQRGLLAELHRVLKPGGRLIVSVPDRAYEEACAVFNGYRNTFHVRVPAPGELGQLLAGFTRVSYAHQIDFLASGVVEEGATDLEGGWRSQPPGPRTDTVETVLAVAVKPPAELARPVPPYRPDLRPFENALHLQVGEKGHVHRLEVALAAERAGRWADRNHHDAVVRRLLTLGPLADPGWQNGLVRAWFRGGAEAYACWDVLPGDWIAQMEAILSAGGSRVGSEAFAPPRHWELAQGGSGAVLRDGISNPPGVRTVLFPRPAATVGVSSLWRWLRRGARSVWFAEAGGWKQYDLLGYFVWRAARWAAGRVFPCARRRPFSPGPRGGSRLMHWAMTLGRRSGPAVVSHPPSAKSGMSALEERVTALDGVSAEPPARKTVHYIGALHPGGAERQLCNLVIGQKRRGLDVRVVTTYDLSGGQGHYADLLERADVPIRQAVRARLAPRPLRRVPWHLLRAVPPNLQSGVVDLIYELLADPPDVLHCWLDQPNVIGAAAGLLAGVPRIILSTRNANPTHFPRLWDACFQGWYRLASRSSRVHFIANSHSGAASYAEWLGLPVGRFHVVHNGVCFDNFPEPTEARRRQARESLGLSPEDRVVCGVFRLAAEKQPELFLDVVRRARGRVPGLRVLLVGAGDLEGRVREVIEEHGMGDWVGLLGRRSDVAPVYLASDVTLLTSLAEGCPNVALESQHLGVPVVATASGGTPDAVAHGVTGLLAGVTDAEGLTAALTRVLLNDDFRRRLAGGGPELVRRRFGLGQMIDNTLAVYGAARAGAAAEGAPAARESRARRAA
jgi:glycosyltransferase involved in cell wall biosynthesis/SAM-dependent methyltransferase